MPPWLVVGNVATFRIIVVCDLHSKVLCFRIVRLASEVVLGMQTEGLGVLSESLGALEEGLGALSGGFRTLVEGPDTPPEGSTPDPSNNRESARSLHPLGRWLEPG